MRFGIALLCLILLSSCFRETIPIRYFKTEKFVLEDTSRGAKEFLPAFEEDIFPIYYLGPIKDTIRIGSRYWRRPDKRFRNSPGYYVYKYSQSQISVFVDTSQPVCQPMEYLNEERVIDRYCDSNRYYHASAIIIRNLSDTVVSLGITFSVSQIHREILNSHGRRVKVNEKSCEGWFCGTGQPHIYLLPGEIIISKIGHFEGQYPVQCRLALGRSNDFKQIYSNVFTEHVNDKLLRQVEGTGCR